jgi:uracil-DNA glycosylase
MSDIQQRVELWLQNHQELYGRVQPALWGEKSQSESIHLTSVHDSTSESVRETPETKNETPAMIGDDMELDQLSDLVALRSFCQSYAPLRTDLDGTNLVFGVGNPNADLLLIGEAPGEQEDLQGEPFVGRAGQLLNKIIEAIGFTRDDIYIANILKHRPPNNRDPLPEERDRSLPVLLKQIEIIHPKIILCLGRISAQTLLGTSDAMKDMRGKFHPWRGYELTVTYHPAALLRNPNWKHDTWADVKMVRARYNELGCKP